MKTESGKPIFSEERHAQMGLGMEFFKLDDFLEEVNCLSIDEWLNTLGNPKAITINAELSTVFLLEVGVDLNLDYPNEKYIAKYFDTEIYAGWWKNEKGFHWKVGKHIPIVYKDGYGAVLGTSPVE